MKMMIRILACCAQCLLLAATICRPNRLDVQQQVVDTSQFAERMALPIERIRPALKAHYVTRTAPSIGWELGA